MTNLYNFMETKEEEEEENLQCKAYRILYDEAMKQANSTSYFDSKKAWISEAIKYAVLIEKVSANDG